MGGKAHGRHFYLCGVIVKPEEIWNRKQPLWPPARRVTPPDRVVGWYSRTKAMASQRVLDAARSLGLNACIVHPSGIMGPEEYAISTTTRTVLQILGGDHYQPAKKQTA